MGVLPVKMNACYILECPKWCDLFMKFLKMFMSKKLRERIVILPSWDKLLDAVGGSNDLIPKGFGK